MISGACCEVNSVFHWNWCLILHVRKGHVPLSRSAGKGSFALKLCKIIADRTPIDQCQSIDNHRRAVDKKYSALYIKLPI